MESKVNKLIRKILKEVRLPSGYFLVLRRFTVQSSEVEWSTVFMQNEIVQMDPNNNTVKGLGANKVWTPKDISFNELRKQENYKVFTSNTRKLTPSDLRGEGIIDAVEFNTTVRAFPRRTEEFDLEPSTKINVKVVESKTLKFTKYESINVDINKGDTVLGGKFKNKKIIVKDIGTDEIGQPIINSKPLLKVRIPKLMPIKEDEVVGEWQVIFHDDYGTETPVKELFATEALAEKWAEGKEYDYQDIIIDDDGNDTWKTFYRFYNPEDKESNYTGYEVNPYLKESNNYHF